MPTEGEEENARARIIAALHDEASGRVVRCCKLALDRGLGDTLQGPAAYFMKSPPVQHGDERARQMVEEFIAAPGAPAPVLEGATPTGSRGDDAGVGAVHCSTVQPVGARVCCTQTGVRWAAPAQMRCYERTNPGRGR